MRRALRLVRTRARGRSDSLLRARRRRGRRVIGGALLLLLSLALGLRTLALLGITLLCFALLRVALLLRGTILLLARRRVRRREIRLPLLRGRVVSLVARGIVAEHDARVQRALANGGGAIRWRGLVRRRHAIDPDAAHSRRRTMAHRYVVRR